jgi:GNAT superfamily N-acetyltransferase
MISGLKNNPVCPGLFRLYEPQLNRAVRVMTASFGDSDFLQHVFPDEQARDRILPLVYQSIVRSFMANDRAFATSEQVEALMLVRHSQERFSWLSQIRMVQMLRVLRFAPLGRTLIKARAFRPIRQKTAWYFHNYPDFVWLEIIAVDPAQRGTGRMSQLMLPLLAYVDSRRTFCLLETENPQNIAIYEHYGFKQILTGQVRLAKHAPIPYYFLAYDPPGILDR